MQFRVVPFISIIGRKLYKTRGFVEPQYLGDPINALRIFNDKLVDEIFVADIRASKDKRIPDFEFIKEMCGECFMPMSYGGGINNFNQASKVFDAGAEKILINSANISGFRLIEEIAKVYGSQSVIAGFDYKKGWLGESFYTLSGTKRWTKDLSTVMKNAEIAGAGEILLMDINREGRRVGINVELIRLGMESVQLPIIISGGASSFTDFKIAIDEGASAIVAGSAFLYNNGNNRSILINYPQKEELDALKKQYNHSKNP